MEKIFGTYEKSPEENGKRREPRSKTKQNFRGATSKFDPYSSSE